MNRIAVVIPCYKHDQMTYDTVKSLVDCTESELTLVLVDDNEDGYDFSYTRNKISELLGSRLLYVKNAKNIGVNASWNAGINTAMHTEIPYICVANNDLIFTKGWDTPLINALNNGMALVSPYSTEQTLPKDFPNGGNRHTNPVGIEILGACFAFKRELIHTIGYVPEQMTHYFGDNWFADQCKMRGLKIGHVYESYIHHLFCITSSKLDNSKWFNEDGKAYNDYCREFKLPE